MDERLGSTIRLLRRRKGWRQADLARAAGSSKTAVGRIERGLVDILAWHAAAEAHAIVELKTAIVDVQELIGTMDRRRRLARRITAERGWQPRSVSVVVLVEDGRTNRRRLIEHRTVLRAAFPSDGRRLAGWMRDPRRAVAILAIWPKVHPGDLGPRSGGSQRMRVGPPRTRQATAGPRSSSNEVTDGRKSTQGPGDGHLAS